MEAEKTKNFQVRWNEPLGDKKCPYMRRWVFLAFGYSIRVHHWIRSDDKRFFHDHPWDFLTIVLKGSYTDVSPIENRVRQLGEGETLSTDERTGQLRFHQLLIAGTGHFRKAEHKHYVEVPKGGAWTLLFCGRPKRKWGFWIKATQFFRPLRYFSKYGHPPCSEQ